MNFFKHMIMGWILISVVVLYHWQKNQTPEDEAKFRQWLEKHQSTSKKLREDQKFKANPKPQGSQASGKRPNEKQSFQNTRKPYSQPCKRPACKMQNDKSLEKNAEAKFFQEVGAAMEEMEKQAMRSQERK